MRPKGDLKIYFLAEFTQGQRKLGEKNSTHSSLMSPALHSKNPGSIHSSNLKNDTRGNE